MSGAHTQVIGRCLDDLEKVPNLAMREVGPTAEQFLLTAAAHEHPAALARTAQVLLARLDPDGAQTAEERHQRRRDDSRTRTPTARSICERT